MAEVRVGDTFTSSSGKTWRVLNSRYASKPGHMILKLGSKKLQVPREKLEQEDGWKRVRRNNSNEEMN